MITKICSRCQTEKFIEDYYLLAERPDRPNRYRKAICKPCTVVYNKEARDALPNKVRASSYRNSSLRSNYSLDSGQYDLMLQSQQGLCAACHKPETVYTSKPLVVDHDHQTGKIRSLLCTKCNLLLGHVKDSEIYLQQLISYLRGHRNV